jgi:hypothetical protein
VYALPSPAHSRRLCFFLLHSRLDRVELASQKLKTG